jgi:exopolysaccharide biosynthesis operon protein EpsL
VSHCLFSKKFIVGAKKWGGISVLLVVLNPALADQLDTVSYVAAGGVSYDDNVFRLPDDADPKMFLGKTTKSDLIRFLTLGMNVDKKYGNQEVMFSGSGTDSKYDNFSDLDYTSWSYKAAWNWRIARRLSGGLNVGGTQTLNNPADTRVYTRNLNTIISKSLGGDWWAGGNWHLLFGASDGKTSNTVNTINYISSDMATREWGVKYDPANGRSVALISRSLQGNYPSQALDPVALIDNGYTERQVELRAAWPISGKSTLTGQLMNIDRRNLHYAQRDYSGIEGNLNYSLSASDKTFLNISLQRTLNSWWDYFSSYFVADSISLSPSWQVTSKTVLHMAVSQGTNDYRGPVLLLPGAPTRNDVNQTIMVGMDWTPQRAVTLSASVQKGKRISTPAYYAGYGFNDVTATFSVQASF